MSLILKLVIAAYQTENSLDRSTPQETADLAIFTVEILNGKLHFLDSVT